MRVRLLLVDDDQALCRRLSGWLAEAEYEVLSFTDADEALRLAERAHCAAALVDLQLPDVPGVEIIARLLRVAPRTRVIAMAAFPQAQDVISAMRAGASDVLEKPIQQPSLLAALERQLAAAGVVARGEDEFNRWLGGRLRALRQAAERSIDDVAEAGGITAAQLSQIERGVSATTTWTLARLCAALHVPLAALFRSP